MFWKSQKHPDTKYNVICGPVMELKFKMNEFVQLGQGIVETHGQTNSKIILKVKNIVHLSPLYPSLFLQRAVGFAAFLPGTIGPWREKIEG